MSYRLHRLHRLVAATPAPHTLTHRISAGSQMMMSGSTPSHACGKKVVFETV